MGSKIRKFKGNVQNPEMELSAWKTVKIRNRLRIHKGIDVQQEERKTTCKGRQSDRRCRKSFTNSPAKRFWGKRHPLQSQTISSRSLRAAKNPDTTDITAKTIIKEGRLSDQVSCHGDETASRDSEGLQRQVPLRPMALSSIKPPRERKHTLHRST